MLDFTSLEQRYKWAKTRTIFLDRSVKLYKKHYPVQTKAEIAEDRMSWTLKTAIRKRPPVVEWGLWHASIVHDLRSMLDNAVWQIAHKGQVPVKPKVLEFPILTESDKWPHASQKIAELPEAYRRCIEGLQPFNRSPGDPIGDALKFLHQLDIQNKHHLPVVTTVSNRQEFMNDYKIDYREDPDPGATTTLRFFRFEYEDGRTLLHQDVPKPIARVTGSKITFTAHFVIIDELGNEIPLLGSLRFMLAGCELVLKELKRVT